MKRICTLLTLLFLALTDFAQERNFNIDISVKGMENQIGILAFYYGDKRFVQDTLKFDAKGTALIKGKKNIPSGVYLIAFPSMRLTSFDIMIRETEFSLSTDTSSFVNDMKVKNSVENKEMFEDMRFMYPIGLLNDSLGKVLKNYKKTDSPYVRISAEIEKLSKTIIQHRKDIIKKYPATLYSKLLKLMLDTDVPEGPRKPNGSLVDTFYTFHYLQQHYFEDLDFSDSALIRSPILEGKIMKYLDQYTFPHPDSIIKSIDYIIGMAKVNHEMYQFCVNEIFLKYARSEIMGQDAIYVDMADKYYLSGAAWWADPSKLQELRERVEAVRPTLLGKIAPDFIVQDSTGKSQSFHDFIPKNKYNLLVFWNSDCGHCQHEIPILKKLYLDSLRELGVRIFAVSTEQTDSSFRAFAARNCAADWVSAADMKGVSAFRREYDVIATPKIFIITRDFRIIAKNIPLESMVDFIKFQDAMTQKETQPHEDK